MTSTTTQPTPTSPPTCASPTTTSRSTSRSHRRSQHEGCIQTLGTYLHRAVANRRCTTREPDSSRNREKHHHQFRTCIGGKRQFSFNSHCFRRKKLSICAQSSGSPHTHKSWRKAATRPLGQNIRASAAQLPLFLLWRVQCRIKTSHSSLLCKRRRGK